MSFSIESTPQGFSLGDPMRVPQWLEVGGAHGLELEQAPGQFTLEVLTTASVGDTITITWPLASVVMTAVAVPDESGTQFSSAPVDAVALTTSLEGYLNQNYYLQRDFRITKPTSTTLRFTARTVGKDYQPSTSECTPGTLGTFTEDVEAKDSKYLDNYSIGVLVEVELEKGSGIYKRLPELTKRADPATGLLRVNVAPLILPSLGYNWPDYGQATMLWAKALRRAYRLIVFERHGTPPEPQFLYVAKAGHAWYAGCRLHEQEAFYYQLLMFELYGTDANRWLTYRGLGGARHEVSAAQQHYLAWYFGSLILSGSDSFSLRVKIYYTDGTDSTYTPLTVANDSSAPGKDEVMIWPTGFEALGGPAVQPSKVPYKYEAWMLTSATGTTPVSNKHTFHLVEEDANELHLEFVNSLGGIESMRTVGEWTTGLELNYQEATLYRTVIEGALPPPDGQDSMNVDQRTTERLQVSSGFVDQAELLALLDVLYSPERKLVDHALGIKRGVRLLNTTHVVRSQGTEGEHLYALNLELQVGDEDTATSNVVPWTHPE